jgi:hypothetical protein
MRAVSHEDFGLLVGFILPGFVALWGLAEFSSTLAGWLANPRGPTVGGFLYVSLASVAVGLIVSAIRWGTVDRLHHWTGLARPTWDDEKLAQRVDGYVVLIQIHYHHYLFYANMFVASLFTYAVLRGGSVNATWQLGWLDGGFVALELLLLGVSRDTLRKYYERSSRLLGETRKEERSGQWRQTCEPDPARNTQETKGDESKTGGGQKSAGPRPEVQAGK